MALNIKRVIKIVSVILLVFVILLISIAYLRYRDLKKTLVIKISEKATSSIGQKVEIADISFSPKEGINLFDIAIKNPEGFDSGNLLYIKRLFLKTRFSNLSQGNFSFDNIAVYSPELTVIRDSQGRLNISERLMQIFKRKPTLKYHIKEFAIQSGTIDFNRDKKYRNDNIDLQLRNVSSEPGIKTLIKGSTSVVKGSRVWIEGWAHLRDEPKQFNLSISSEDIPLSIFEEIIHKYRINTEKTTIMLNLNMEGNTEAGVHVTSKIHIKNAEFFLFQKEIKNIELITDAFFNIRDESIVINNLTLHADQGLSLQAKALIPYIKRNPVFSSQLKIDRIDLSALNIRDDLTLSGILTSDNILMKGTLKATLPEISGRIAIRNAALKKGKKNIFKDASLNVQIQTKGKDSGFKADTNVGKISTTISGTIRRFAQKDRIIEMSIIQPEVKAADIRDALWDVFPDNLLYAGLDGSLSSNISIQHSDTLMKVEGKLFMKNLVLQGENGEYSIGPVNGVMPIVYSRTNNSLGGKGGFENKKEIRLPSFERSEFDHLSQYYSRKTLGDDYSRITIGTLQYGFKFLDNINIWLKQEGSVLNIERFSGNIFGGRLNGSAVVDISDEINYRAGFLLEGLSLTKLCEGIEPVKGYLSGKVDGIANVKGTGAGISHLIGKADFWTYSTADEKTKISREFLQKIGGISLKAYLGDRKFDKGIMNLYLQNGFVIFRDLELSNRNLLGMQDLSVKVAPLSNRIAIDHLMWSITEAAQRAQKNN